MNWVRAMRQKPKDRQEVLVVNKDQFFIATYVASDGKFYCKNGTIFGITEEVKWAELLPPAPDI